MNRLFSCILGFLIPDKFNPEGILAAAGLSAAKILPSGKMADNLRPC
jgi:hypothetical protein